MGFVYIDLYMLMFHSGTCKRKHFQIDLEYHNIKVLFYFSAIYFNLNIVFARGGVCSGGDSLSISLPNNLAEV